uniref:Transcription initiation factor IIA gamma chain n=1 Tax=Amorphochlora amoebiformis TaxID=1561963 RepID=A0A0H5BIL4_9EUKA|nr:transcription initiation factor IIA gamma chain [Amorphochlora amoebiformis]|mmetsp:Transcript_29256/g.46699  ORF Transcript_29256/g.46699 Transcript_29256/m.46699 type:complete len:126 (+) Transcript_29256:105-482(+)
MKKNKNPERVFDRYTIYRTTNVGLELIKILINLYKKHKIKTYNIFKILNKFDEYIHFLIKKRINSSIRISGFLEEYKHIDDIWIFSIENLKFLMDLNKNVFATWRIEIFCDKCDILLIESKKPKK